MQKVPGPVPGRTVLPYPNPQKPVPLGRCNEIAVGSGKVVGPWTEVEKGFISFYGDRNNALLCKSTVGASVCLVVGAGNRLGLKWPPYHPPVDQGAYASSLSPPSPIRVPEATHGLPLLNTPPLSLEAHQSLSPAPLDLTPWPSLSKELP